VPRSRPPTGAGGWPSWTRSAGRPARRVARARAVGWGVALDDVGAEPASLAVMPFVRPDVIKLDLRLVQGRTTAEVARIVNAVRAQAELTGGPHPGRGHREPAPIDSRTPFEVVSSERAPKDLLLPMSMHIEHKSLDAAEPGVLLACFQQVRHFTPATRARFDRLSARAALTGAVGVGMPRAPAQGVRGASLGPENPLRGEWGREHGRAPLRRRPGGQGLRRRRPGRRPEIRLRQHPRPGAGRPGRPAAAGQAGPGQLAVSRSAGRSARRGGRRAAPAGWRSRPPRTTRAPWPGAGPSPRPPRGSRPGWPAGSATS
jgi:hypothetical protein